LTTVILEVPRLRAEHVVFAASMAGLWVSRSAGVPRRVLDIDSSLKSARFVRFLRLLQHSHRDVRGRARLSHPGFPRSTAASSSTARNFSTPTPKRRAQGHRELRRKAYGGAYCVMGSKHIRTDIKLRLATAEIAVMESEGAVDILYRRELAEASDKASARRSRVLN